MLLFVQHEVPLCFGPGDDNRPLRATIICLVDLVESEKGIFQV